MLSSETATDISLSRGAVRAPWRRPALPPFALALGFLLPAIGLAMAFDYWPTLQSLRLMFYNWNLVAADAQFVGLQNFQTIFGDPRFMTALRNTAIYAAALIPLQIFLPLGIALVLRPLASSRMSPVYRILLFMPMVISLPVASVVWLWMLNPLNGIFSQVVVLAGGTRVNWLTDPATAMASVIVVAAWSSLGFNILLYLASFGGIARDVREAARLDGASGWRLFRDIEWPLISPTFFFVVLTTVLFVNNDIFSVINIMTKGGPYSATTNVLYYLYERGFKFFQAGEASALAMVVVTIYLLVTWLQFKVGERRVHYGG